MSGIRGNARRPRSRPSRDPYGLLPAGLPLAPLLSLIGLLVVTVLTLNLLGGRLPFVLGGASGSGGPPVKHTPTPSNIVVIPDDPRADVPGTIAYAKNGNIWVQSGRAARQLTSGGRDAMPSISPDGAFVYFIRTRPETGLWPASGSDRYYSMDVPSLMRVAMAAGSEPEQLLDGRIRSGRRIWSAWIREPVVSPDGKTVALLTDLPDPSRSDVVLQLFDLETKKLTRLDVSELAPLGHQDPAWRPDGLVLTYVRNGRDGSTGTPTLWNYVVETKKSRAMTNPAYLHPSWSPDGKWITATRTSAFGTDIAILNAADGAEVVRLTDDGASWAPVWSPRGDAIAFLHTDGEVVDLRMIPLAGSAPSWTPEEALDLTSLSGLDGASRPDWYIPASQLPPPTPAPSGSPAASPSGS